MIGQSPSTPIFALVFPGQGSQFAGMGKEVYETTPAARDLFQEADELLHLPLSRLILEGSEEELRQTEIAQPAILTVSIACHRLLEELSDGQPPKPIYVAGHSLGEYSALVVSGAISFAEALSLVRWRGLVMAEASNSHPGGMAAVIGLEPARLEQLCRECADGTVTVANYNSPDQLVISGELEAVELVADKARMEGAKRVIPLPVSGGFHSPLMNRAATAFASHVAAAPIADATIPVVANATARPIIAAQEIKDELQRQLLSPVLWLQSIEWMLASGVELFAEVGPGRVLAGLVRRCGGKVVASIGGIAGARSFLAALSADSQSFLWKDW